MTESFRKYVYSICKQHCLLEEGKGPESEDFSDYDYTKDAWQSLRNDLSDEELRMMEPLETILHSITNKTYYRRDIPFLSVDNLLVPLVPIKPASINGTILADFIKEVNTLRPGTIDCDELR